MSGGGRFPPTPPLVTVLLRGTLAEEQAVRDCLSDMPAATFESRGREPGTVMIASDLTGAELVGVIFPVAYSSAAEHDEASAAAAFRACTALAGVQSAGGEETSPPEPDVAFEGSSNELAAVRACLVDMPSAQVTVTPTVGGQATWTLAPKPRADATSIDLLVQVGCAGRIAGANVLLTPSEVRVNVLTESLLPRPDTCPDPRPVPYRVELTEPVGDREVVEDS